MQTVRQAILFEIFLAISWADPSGCTMPFLVRSACAANRRARPKDSCKLCKSEFASIYVRLSRASLWHQEAILHTQSGESKSIAKNGETFCAALATLATFAILGFSSVTATKSRRCSRATCPSQHLTQPDHAQKGHLSTPFRQHSAAELYST